MTEEPVRENVSAEKPEDVADSRRGGSRVIGRVLPVAVRLWLLSQVEQVADLALQLEGRDRDIITGYLPKVSVSAQQAVYKGIHLGRVQLSATDIRINIGQVIRGKPLRLLKEFPVLGEVALSDDDLNASLASALLAEGLENFWRSLLQNPALGQAVEHRYGPLALHADVSLKRSQIRLSDQRLGLSFYPHAQGKTAAQPIILGTALSVISGNLLQLNSPRWLEHLDDLSDPAKGLPIDALEGFRWHLGRDVQLTQLTLGPQRLLCCGQINVNP